MFEELREQLRKNQDTDQKIDSGLTKIGNAIKDIKRLVVEADESMHIRGEAPDSDADLSCLIDELKLILEGVE